MLPPAPRVHSCTRALTASPKRTTGRRRQPPRSARQAATAGPYGVVNPQWTCSLIGPLASLIRPSNSLLARTGNVPTRPCKATVSWPFTCEGPLRLRKFPVSSRRTGNTRGDRFAPDCVHHQARCLFPVPEWGRGAATAPGRFSPAARPGPRRGARRSRGWRRRPPRSPSPRGSRGRAGRRWRCPRSRPATSITLRSLKPMPWPGAGVNRP